MKKYKLIGFFNMFDIVPDMVYPIFQNENEDYFQESKDGKVETLYQ